MKDQRRQKSYYDAERFDSCCWTIRLDQLRDILTIAKATDTNIAIALSWSMNEQHHVKATKT